VAQLEKYGPGILMLLFFLPFLTNGQVSIFRLIEPIIDGLTDLISGGNAGSIG
jgi:hypothetical protein